MKWKRIYSWAIWMFFLQVVTAQDIPVAHQDTIVTENGLNISGFADASYFFDNTTGENTFGLDQVEIDLKKNYGATGSMRIDLEWSNDGAGGMDPNVEQAFMTMNIPYLTESTLQFGKFNAPIGFELMDPNEMYQYSHALVYDYGLPGNLSGVMVSSQLNSRTNLSVYICNGWDQNADLNTGKTFGGRLGLSLFDQVTMGLSAITGAENGPEGEFLTVWDVDITFTPADGWLFGGELNWGRNTASDSSQTWNGFLLMAHHDFNSIYGITLRLDYFNDADATRLESQLPEKRKAVTLAPTFVLREGMGALFELRQDFSDKDVFTDRNRKPCQSSLHFAFELTYSF